MEIKVKTKEDINVIAMEITKGKVEHEVDHGQVNKTKEDINVIAMVQFKMDFKLKSLPITYFIIPNEFNDMVKKKKKILLLLKVI